MVILAHGSIIRHALTTHLKPETYKRCCTAVARSAEIADFRTVYRDYFGSCSVTHFRAVCGQPFLGSRGLASPAHQCTEVPKAHNRRGQGH